jgi:hypothetical protein
MRRIPRTLDEKRAYLGAIARAVVLDLDDLVGGVDDLEHAVRGLDELAPGLMRLGVLRVLAPERLRFVAASIADVLYAERDSFRSTGQLIEVAAALTAVALRPVGMRIGRHLVRVEKARRPLSQAQLRRAADLYEQDRGGRGPRNATEMLAARLTGLEPIEQRRAGAGGRRIRQARTDARPMGFSDDAIAIVPGETIDPKRATVVWPTGSAWIDEDADVAWFPFLSGEK